MKRRFDKPWIASMKAASQARERAEADQLEASRPGRRASDSVIAAAILEHGPELARAHFRKAIRRLEEYFEAALDVAGAQAARDVIEKIHIITGDRRRERKQFDVRFCCGYKDGPPRLGLAGAFSGVMPFRVGPAGGEIPDTGPPRTPF